MIYRGARLESLEKCLPTAGFRTEILEVKNWRPYSDIIYLGSKIE